ncbi:protein rolling stone-like [Branchiostoma floridae]|uniref:Protein rolling stone-like n=1 Tax=Branchiostoma floridae TaxID=7739 RepID=A0A9J7MFA7_BRAFL|nr:protein rolling stone-like [Branchiostoma floridae]
MACRERFRQEFRLKSFGLDHGDHQDFTRSPWFSSPVPFLIYRAVICLYQVCTYATAHSLYARLSPKSLIYLTELGYIILTAHTVVSAVLCFVDFFCSRCRAKSSDDPPTFPDADVTTARSTDAIHQTSQSPRIPWYYKGYWVFYNMVFSAGLYITIAFWALLANDEGTFSILFHAINSVVIVIDVVVSGLPYRLLHFVYPSAFGFAYMLFTVIYWAAGGTDFFDRPWIYPVIDYGGKPGLAAGVAAGSVLVAIPLCHVILFGLALAREMLSGLVRRPSLTISEDVRMEQHREEERA